MITHPPMTRAYALGLGYGSVWLVAVYLAFGIFDMVTLTTTVGWSVLTLGSAILVGARSWPSASASCAAAMRSRTRGRGRCPSGDVGSSEV